MCRSLFAPIIARLRSIGGRSRRIERAVADLLTLNQQMEIIMTATKAELLAEIGEVKNEVAALLKGKDDAITAAVAKAKAAWDADNEAEHTEAMAALEDIRKSLSDNPFTPSGN